MRHFDLSPSCPSFHWPKPVSRQCGDDCCYWRGVGPLDLSANHLTVLSSFINVLSYFVAFKRENKFDIMHSDPLTRVYSHWPFQLNRGITFFSYFFCSHSLVLSPFFRVFNVSVFVCFLLPVIYIRRMKREWREYKGRRIFFGTRVAFSYFICPFRLVRYYYFSVSPY